MRNITFILTISAALITSSCSDKYADGTRSAGITKGEGGALIGGVAGGVAGSQLGSGTGSILGAVGGTAIGALAGHAIGNRMDQPIDTAQYSRNNARPANSSILQEALEYNQVGQASNQGMYNGKVATITPTQTFTNGSGQNCRAFQVLETTGKLSSGTACRQSDGYWR